MHATDEKTRRKVHRSPSYPAFSLGEAIDKARIIYDHEKRSPTTADVIASHLGYSAALGLGGRAVSALRQYGLIEDAGGKLKLSDLGFTLVHFDRDSEAWKRAVREALTRPTLFNDLLEEFPDGIPSDATLRQELLEREFNPGSIMDVLEIFRNSLTLAEFEPLVHNDGGDTSMHTATASPVSEQPTSRVTFQPVVKPTVSIPAPIRSYAFDISIPREVKGELKIVGQLGKDDLDRLRKALNGQLAMIEAAMED